MHSTKSKLQVRLWRLIKVMGGLEEMRKCMAEKKGRGGPLNLRIHKLFLYLLLKCSLNRRHPRVRNEVTISLFLKMHPHFNFEQHHQEESPSWFINFARAAVIFANRQGASLSKPALRVYLFAMTSPIQTARHHFYCSVKTSANQSKQK